MLAFDSFFPGVMKLQPSLDQSMFLSEWVRFDEASHRHLYKIWTAQTLEVHRVVTVLTRHLPLTMGPLPPITKQVSMLHGANAVHFHLFCLTLHTCQQFRLLKTFLFHKLTKLLLLFATLKLLKSFFSLNKFCYLDFILSIYTSIYFIQFLRLYIFSYFFFSY